MSDLALAVAGKSGKRKLDESDHMKAEKKAKLETKALKAKRPGFTEEKYNETSYYVEKGLRKVYPYYFTFTTFCKGRWVGQQILDVFAKEFRAHPPEEYERCIKAGTLTVNYKPVDVNYRLQHNDLLANTVHRHEVPVAYSPIPIMHVSDDLVAVDKPASVPVHPCGRYRHNTVVFILAKEHNLKNLRTIHRLDRLTSGLLLFGRTLERARQLEQQIRSRQVEKEYVCRVEGEFPTESVICNKSIKVVSYKIGVCKVDPDGKDCETEFRRMSYNGSTSVVLCKPKSGRMHQIRVHLQYLGYPIVNDPLYNHEVFGPERGKGGAIPKSDEQLIQDLIKTHNAENWLGIDGDGDGDSFGDTLPASISPPLSHEVDDVTNVLSNGESVQLNGHQDKARLNSAGNSDATSVSTTSSSPVVFDESVDGCLSNRSHDKYPFELNKITYNEHCYECKVKFRDPKPKDLVMHLHALTYKGPDWAFKTNMPDWAKEDWVEDL